MERFVQPIKQFFSKSVISTPSMRETLEENPDPTMQTSSSFPTQTSSFVPALSIFSVILVITITTFFVLGASSKLLPETMVEDVKVGGLTVEEALALLKQNYPEPPLHSIELTLMQPGSEQIIVVASSSAQLEATYHSTDTVVALFTAQKQHTFAWFKQLLFPAPLPKEPLPLAYSPEKLAEMIKVFAQEFDTEPVFPQARLGQSGNVQTLSLSLGENVENIDTTATLQALQTEIKEKMSLSFLQENGDTVAFAPVTRSVSQALTQDEKKKALETLSLMVGQELVFRFDVFTKKIPDTTLISFFQFPEGFADELIKDLVESWKKELDRPSQDAVFIYDKQTLKVTEFQPHKNGLALNEEKTHQAIQDGVLELLEQAREKRVGNSLQTDTPQTASRLAEKISLEKPLSFAETLPQNTLESTNTLGIKERIGFGESYYAHSIPSRVHNVSLTADRINNTLVAPGKEFSFNKALGDVSAATGFQPAYVIKDGQTVLGDGGGVCQVSTTLFRSILDAGLKITLRLPHSYRVSYYELDNDPGFDATVYAGNVDFRFINDTDHYILIHTLTDRANLYMNVEIYGTSDGRTTEISGYKSWDHRAPLPTEYIPDPSLPPGKLKQVDWAASGIRTQFTHTIRDKNGEIMSQKTYTSNYRPWAAKYLQGI